MNKYVYEGPVMEFDRVIDHNWSSATYAPNENKARSNLTYQFKKEYFKNPGTKITLPGKIKLVGRRERTT